MKVVVKGLLIIFTGFLIFSGSSYAQLKRKDKVQLNEYLEVAGNYYDNEQFYKAAEYYEKAFNIDQKEADIAYKLAECYRKSLHYDQAETYYNKSIKLGSNKKKVRFWLAKMQKLNGKYEKSEKSFKQFIHDFDPETKEDRELLSWAILLRDGCLLAIEAKGKPMRNYHFQLLPEPVNTQYTEFSPQPYKNDSTIIITSSRSNSNDETFGRLGEAFSDNYRFQIQGDQWVETNYDDELDELNTKYNDATGAFSSDYKKFYFTTCTNPTGGCEIMVSEYEDEQWQEPEALNKNINPKGVWNAQPSLSPSGDTLFFVSKRDGGYGQHDIWMSIRQGNGDEENWGEAQNLGSAINTPYKDFSPSYYADKEILFFSSDGHEGFGGLDIFMARGKQFDTIMNIGKPFNSNRDDLNFILGDTKGYIASNREGGMGKDDIYMFNIESQEAIIASIEKDSLEVAKSISIVGTLLLDNGEPAVNIPVFLTDQSGEELKVVQTNKKGFFRFDNLSADKNYRVTMHEEDADVTKEIEYRVDDVEVDKSQKEPSKTTFEHVYFDFDEASLRPEAKKVLKTLAAYIKENPDAQIELRANTDSLGPEGYNYKLSEKRGKTCYEYLKQLGVDPQNMVIDPRGEQNPIAPNTNPIGRQINRRVEFYIIGIDEAYVTPYMVHIAEPETTLYGLAQQYDMELAELKAINGIEDNELTAFKPLRVKRVAGQDSAISAATRKYMHNFPEKWEKLAGKIRQKNLKTLEEDKQIIHIVEPLETLSKLARRYGTTVQAIQEANNMRGTKLSIGQKLKIPQ